MLYSHALDGMHVPLIRVVKLARAIPRNWITELQNREIS